MARCSLGPMRSGRGAVPRRRFLQASGLAAASVALAAACTSASETPAAAPRTPEVAGATNPPTAIATAARATATVAPRQPKYGGTFAFSFPNDTPHLDVHQTATALLHKWGAGTAYSRLLGFKAGPGVPPGTIIVRG